MVKSMVKLCLPEFSDFTRVFSAVTFVCNGPLIAGLYSYQVLNCPQLGTVIALLVILLMMYSDSPIYIYE